MSPVCCREVATEVEAMRRCTPWAQERAGDRLLPATDCTHLIVYPLKVAISDKDRSPAGAGPPPRGRIRDLVGKDRHPGEPTNVRDRDKDAEYMINTVAQQQWLAEPGRRPR